VHPVEFIRPLSVETLEQIIDDSVKLVTIAPETDVSSDGAAIKYLHEKNIVTSLGHSNATFSQAEEAFSRGVHLITHIFNALPAVHHRTPGAVIAALLNDTVSCAIICDGLHVCQDMVKFVLKTKTKEKTVLVTDSAQIGTNEGGLVGSSITLNEAVINMVQWEAASFLDAIRMATWNPAKILNLHEYVGHLAVGKAADIVVWDQTNLSVKHVFLRGQKIF
jgi:N-acetylglucosamine-6-phosphate deacetylase